MWARSRFTALQHRVRRHGIATNGAFVLPQAPGRARRRGLYSARACPANVAKESRMSNRSWSLALSMLLASGLASGVERSLPPGAVLVPAVGWQPALARAESDAAAVLARLARGEPDAAWALMQGWQDPERFELAADAVIRALQPARSDAASDYLLQKLAAEPVRLFRQHDETAAAAYLPVFDIGASARSALALRTFVRDRDALLAEFAVDPVAALGKQVARGDLVAAAIAAATPAQQARIAEAAANGRLELPSPGWVALARALPRVDVLDAAMRKADPVDLLPLVQELAPRLPTKHAINWLESLASKHEYASSAVLALGALAARSTDAEMALVKHLGRPATGASAAAALARMDRPDRVQRIAALLAASQDEAVVTDLALALRLEGSEAARKQLARLENDPRLRAAAKAELQR
jgi:hypothetical protein